MFFALGCEDKIPSASNAKSFRHDLNGTLRPWFGEPKDKRGDFNFAIVSDLTGGERDRIFEIAVAQVNRFDTQFVLSVGDLIEGGSRDTLQLTMEWDDFDRRAQLLESPFFHLGGNHDFTNAVMKDFWANRYGPAYYHFIYNNVLFLMLDSEDFAAGKLERIDEAREEAMKIIRGEKEGIFELSEYAQMPESRTGEMSLEQLNYFKEVIERNPNVAWTFVLMHKPMWKNKELGHWSKLEEFLQGSNYTVINGHLHSMSHEQEFNMDHIMLGTTGGYQNSEDRMAFDHITYVKMRNGKPVITHLKMEGILDETGHVPLGGDTISFSAFKKQS